jgi:hypothetical protein
MRRRDDPAVSGGKQEPAPGVINRRALQQQVLRPAKTPKQLKSVRVGTRVGFPEDVDADAEYQEERMDNHSIFMSIPMKPGTGMRLTAAGTVWDQDWAPAPPA